MKRYFIIFLTLVVVLASFPVAASAEEYEPVQQDLTDLFSLQENDTRIFSSNTGSYSLTFNTGGYYIGYIEFLFNTNLDITSASIFNTNCTIYEISSDLYRIYCSPSNVFASINLNLSGNTSSSFLYILSAEFSANNRSSYPVSCSVSYSSYDFSSSSSYSSGSVSYSLPSVGIIGSKDFITDFVISNFKLYDYINLSLYFSCISISSITVGSVDTYQIPFTVSYLDSFDMDFEASGSSVSNFPNSPYNVKLNIDLRDLDLRNINNIVIQINGSVYRNSVSHNLFYINGIYGFVVFNDADPVIFWFRKTYTGLASWFNTLFDQLQDIFTGRSQDQTAADSFNDSIDDQSNELEDLTGDLNSVTRPPLSDVNLSSSGMVDSSTIVLATSGLGSIMSNTIILRVLLMALTFALAGFILFGKR